jgi:cyclohexa-1,5-dienecarbonyl-CoA hydratase
VSSPPLDLRRDGGVRRVTLSRPPLNVLDRELNRALAAEIRAADADASVAVVILDGGAARGFSAGVEIADHVPGRIEGMLEDFHGAIRALLAADCVTIAAIHGFAQGGGLELALACDLVVAEDDAKLAFPEIALGCYPPVAAALLPSRVGWGAACEWTLTGDPVSVSRAHALGLVQRVCAPGGREAETARLVASLLARSPAVLREAKRALREGAGAGAGAPAALRRIEARYLDRLMALEDAAEGIRAHAEKRDPRWQNR